MAGLIPTAYEPHDITFSADGRTMYIVNGKSATGPNPDHLSSNTALDHLLHVPGRQRRGGRRRQGRRTSTSSSSSAPRWSRAPVPDRGDSTA